MNRDDSREVIRRLLRHDAERTQDCYPAPMTECASVFLDSERWQRERQQFFLDTPQVVGFAGEIAEPGSFICREVMSIPVSTTSR